uniref:Uncharacterized protein n=1 Tax=Trypanosoma vivax (strain Y486) TaxID=1055687 RepID=G0UBR4_TRYVY|nr:hypothetical protein, unlikely [Trypanosoma vivax Y486]
MGTDVAQCKMNTSNNVQKLQLVRISVPIWHTAPHKTRTPSSLFILSHTHLPPFLTPSHAFALLASGTHAHIHTYAPDNAEEEVRTSTATAKKKKKKRNNSKINR